MVWVTSIWHWSIDMFHLDIKRWWWLFIDCRTCLFHLQFHSLFLLRLCLWTGGWNFHVGNNQLLSYTAVESVLPCPGLTYPFFVVQWAWYWQKGQLTITNFRADGTTGAACLCCWNWCSPVCASLQVADWSAPLLGYAIGSWYTLAPDRCNSLWRNGATTVESPTSSLANRHTRSALLPWYPSFCWKVGFTWTPCNTCLFQ